MTFSSSSDFSTVVSLSLTLIVALTGLNSATTMASANFLTVYTSLQAGIPMVNANTLAADYMNPIYAGSLESNLIAVGGLLGPLQNSCPSEVLWLRGKL